MPYNFARLMSEAAGSKIHFLQCCRPGDGFGESDLTEAAYDVLLGHKLSPKRGFSHPTLAPIASTGRKPELDLVGFDHYPAVSVAVECKWAGSSHGTPENILWDLMRLASLHKSGSTQACFLLGGKGTDIRRLFGRSEFGFRSSRGTLQRPLLRSDSRTLSLFHLLPKEHHRITFIAKQLKKAPEASFPHSFLTQFAGAFPIQSVGKRYQVLGWRVLVHQTTDWFVPAKLKAYKRYFDDVGVD